MASSLFEIFRCACSSEHITIEVIDLEDDDLGYVCIYQLARVGRMSFIDRMRYCWKIIREGKPYGDQVCLNQDALRGLSKAASSAADILASRKKVFIPKKKN